MQRSNWIAVPLIVATSVMTSLSAVTMAQTPPRRAPPPEAYAACESKASGDKCSVVAREVIGVCIVDADQKLFCAPDRPPPGGPHGPPPEAYTACSAKQDGDSCSVRFPDGALRSGVCRTGPDDKVACAPAADP